MTTLNIRGVKINITESMDSRATKALSKLFGRHPPISHSLTVKQEQPGVAITLNYQDSVARKTATVKTADFYHGVIEVRDSILSQLDKEHKSRVDKKRRSGVLDRADNELDDLLDADDEFIET